MARQFTFRPVAAVSLLVLLLTGAASAQSYQSCLQWRSATVSGVYYVINTDSSGTRMDRYDSTKSPLVLLDTNTYAALNPPSPKTASWTEGIAFAVEMQRRNAWPVPNAVTDAFWDDLGNGQFIWRFQSPYSGGTYTIPFTNIACVAFQTPRAQALPTQAGQPGPTPVAPAGGTEAPLTTTSGLPGTPNEISGAFAQRVSSWLLGASAITVAIFANAVL